MDRVGVLDKGEGVRLAKFEFWGRVHSTGGPNWYGVAEIAPPNLYAQINKPPQT